ncbi:MAG: aspartyl/glutamyl-tRNA amidotransferase subunit C [Gemmatimonadota bacterium]|nr:aspartyl/glutamyl-tRNA amidotransferase subunit C [Gemmatimonadota bacterium]
MAVTRDEVVHVARLARLALDEARVPALVEQLNGILAHMEVLEKAATGDVCAVVGVGDAGMPLREDTGPPLALERPPEGFAPAMRDGFFLVPRLATHEDAAEALE